MKKILSLCLVLTVLISCVACGKTEPVNADSTTTTENTTVSTTESATESTTESTTENTTTTTTTTTTTEKQTETTTKKKVETTTKKIETTKKPNKPETTTKKPVTTTKPSKPETTTKAPEMVTANPNDLSDAELERIWNEVGCNSQAEYDAYLKNLKNYKCIYCGEHSCPSIGYRKNRLGDTVLGYIDESKCPAIKAEKIKCDVCGKILVDIDDERWRTQPDKYCNGYCDFNFG